MNDLLLTFYGDDFTGSTDALEALNLGGVPTALFVKPPTPAQLAEDFPHIRAIGVAGTSRAMTPQAMDETLPAIFRSLQMLNAPICHYKVCSTFDSSPTVGNIGRALEIGQRVFSPPFVPIIVGTPVIRRFVVFGNLFATAELANGVSVTFRIDRHPTMASHPVTPMHESDLRRHLALQTDQPIGLVDLLQLAMEDSILDQTIAALRDQGNRAILFDTVDHTQMLKIGRLLLRQMTAQPLFAIGSSGVETALTAAWREQGSVHAASPPPTSAPATQIIVMAGSASPATAEQIGWAECNGFASIALDVPHLVDPETADAAIENHCQRALTFIRQGANVQFYSTRGPIPTEQSASISRDAPSGAIGMRLGKAQGKLLHVLLERTDIKRVCVAGGDTCGQVVQQLDIDAMTVVASLAPGAPLCRANARSRRIDGLELALKGGQVGGVDYFGRVCGKR